ncbi:MAG: DNA-protecting protein DprA [Magnetococcales bacterium]|nr:DNA-protecting protein DprA [Magnetococcales bacterium]
MDPELLIDWLRLVRSPGIGPATLGHLIRHLGSPEALLSATRQTLATVPGIRPAMIQQLERFRREIPAQPMAQELERLHAMGGRMLVPGTPDYPMLLSTIHDPPAALFALGNTTLLHDSGVTITGTRKATARGQIFTAELACDLTRAGIVVISGLSEGIDAAAHRGALESPGPTIGVLATGLDIFHPAKNRELQRVIAGHGCLVSEAPLGLLPVPWAFPPRARILSGLARGVVIVEAPERSGSLITAHTALEQGREVFAVPGPPNDPNTRGTHSLLRQGARLVEGVADILEELHWSSPPLEPLPVSLPETFSRLQTSGLSAEVAAILTHIQAGATQEDDLARCCQLTVAALSRILLQLELSGLVQRLPGGRYTITNRP